MKDMHADAWMVPFILAITFLTAFIATTIFFDSVERGTSYYDQGRQESTEVSNG